jgi:hypothetical protein
MKRNRLLGVAAIVVVVLAVAAISLRAHSTKTASTKPSQKHAQPIPEGTNFAQVRVLSAGKKPTCLTHDTALDQTVKADDALPYEKSMSTAIGTVIPDMPAGYTTTYLHTYTPTSATGYEIFSGKNQKPFVGNLKSFNFSIHRSGPDAVWKLTSFVACSE